MIEDLCGSSYCRRNGCGMLGSIANNGDNEYAHKDIAEAELMRSWLNGADQDLTQPCDRDSGAGEHRDRLPKRPGIRSATFSAASTPRKESE